MSHVIVECVGRCIVNPSPSSGEILHIVATKNKNDLGLVISVFVLLVLMAAGEIAACRGMYADGPNMLINMIKAHNFLLFEPHRIYHTFLTQYPVVMALQSGVTDMAMLRYLYSSALIFWPLFFWLIALYVVRADRMFWPLVMFFCFVFFNIGFFAISEANLCIALTACCIACMARPQPMSGFERTVMMIVALLYPLEYASTLFFGPVLFVFAAARFLQAKGTGWKFYWFIIILCFLASAGTGIWEVLTPRDPGNFIGARDYHILLLDGRFWNLLLFGTLTYSTLIFTGRKFAALVWVGCGLLLMAIMLNLSEWAPTYAYSIRMYMTLAVVPIIMFLTGYSLRSTPAKKPSNRGKVVTPPMALPVFGLFAILCLMDMDLSARYTHYLSVFRHELNTQSGFIPYELSQLQYDAGERLFFDSWTHISTSLVLRGGNDKAIILNPRWFRGYQGLDPPDQIPDLSAYYRN